MKRTTRIHTVPVLAILFLASSITLRVSARAEEMVDANQALEESLRDIGAQTRLRVKPGAAPFTDSSAAPSSSRRGYRGNRRDQPDEARREDGDSDNAPPDRPKRDEADGNDAQCDQTPPPRRPRQAPRSKSRERPSASKPSGNGIGGGVGSVILLMVSGVVSMVLLVIIVRGWLLKSRPKKARKQEGDGKTPTKNTAAPTLRAVSQDEVDKLAEEGRFTEAMHLLLLRSLNDIHQNLRIAIAFSLTSREVAKNIPMNASARTAFADIVGRVEVAYFGGLAPTEADFQACRTDYAHLAASLSEREGAS